MCWYEVIVKDSTTVCCYYRYSVLIFSLTKNSPHPPTPLVPSPLFLHVETITPATKQEQDPRQGRQAPSIYPLDLRETGGKLGPPLSELAWLLILLHFSPPCKHRLHHRPSPPPAPVARTQGPPRPAPSFLLYLAILYHCPPSTACLS